MRVCESTDIPEGGRLVLDVGSQAIGIFRLSGRLYAYENVCPHQGGPVCQGAILPCVEEQLDADSKATTGFRFDPSNLHIVCPWHGLEFSINTGEHAGASGMRLSRVEVRESEGHVIVDD